MKIILVLLDGLGDRAYPQLNHRTPLQAAETPNLDRLAAAGSNGLFHASYPGQCLPSEIAHYLLFGYERIAFPGRGLLEAIGEGVPHRKEDVLCMAHLCEIEWQDGQALLKRNRDDVPGSREELGRVYGLLERFENSGIRIHLVHTGRNDAILVLSGAASDRVSDADPIQTGQPIARIEPLSGPSAPGAQRTAAALNAYLQHCHRILCDPNKNPYRDAVPANFLVTLRCGTYRPQIPFREIWGLQGALIASQAVYAGLAHAIGLDFIPAVDTVSPGSDLQERIALAVADTDHDFVHVHTKAPDEAAHKKDPHCKRDVISQLDRGLDALVETMQRRDDILLAITADHCTPSGSSLVHSGEPVPVLICGPHVRRDRVRQFDEIEAAGGCLGMLRGKEMMAMLLNYANHSVFYSHRLGPEEHLFFPPKYKPFNQK
jgi:2,3-bisphosphoglycerate-independent phosphoglycerate mutase